MQHHARKHGHSKYGVERMVKGFFDLLTVLLITKFRSRPLHLFGLVGLMFSVVGGGCLAYLAILWFLGMGPIGNRPLMTLGFLLVVVGLQLVSTGMLGEMINNNGPKEQNYVIRSIHEPRPWNEQLSKIPDAQPNDASDHRSVPQPIGIES